MYDKLYCVKENQPPPAYHSLYLSFFLSLQLKFCNRFLSSYKSYGIQTFYTSRGWPSILCKRNNEVYIYCFLLFPFSFFSISHSYVMLVENFHQRFRRNNFVLNFSTKLGYVKLYCAIENHAYIPCYFLYLSIFLSLQQNVLLQISQLLF